jgi:hypothetical protein
MHCAPWPAPCPAAHHRRWPAARRGGRRRRERHRLRITWRPSEKGGFFTGGRLASEGAGAARCLQCAVLRAARHLRAP